MSMEQPNSPHCICGIIMPISHLDEDHTADHWENVRRVIEISIERAGLTPQPVWQNGEFDVIQARILKNLFENEIVVCDISTRNPNVMLEFGMRLTTKKPTIVIAEHGTPLPFDTSVINTEFYNHSLDYVATEDFINRLSKSISDTRSSVKNGSYHPYMEHFRFETVEPATISVTADRRIESRLDEVLARIARLEILGSQSPMATNRSEHSATNIRSNFTVGTRVYHEKFGFGEITNINRNQLEVQFDKAGQKRVLDTFVRIE